VKASEVIKLLERDGWLEVTGKASSHRQFKHPTKQGKVTVSFHRGDMPKGTLHSIFKQAGWK
jgi:predicted RNA binding protein YcfA (HicA-like mRNA interferase family)